MTTTWTLLLMVLYPNEVSITVNKVEGLKSLAYCEAVATRILDLAKKDNLRMKCIEVAR